MTKAISSRTTVPAEVFADLDWAIAAGPDEGYLYLWAARVSAFASQLNPGEKGPQTERCRLMLQKAIELGVPAVQYRTDATFQAVLGDPAVYAKNWRTPATEADFSFWRLGDPCKEFVE